MKENQFVGRDEELSRLEELKGKNSSSLLVVRGRRRIGKSRLLSEFGKKMKSYFLIGLPPTPNTSAESEKEEFALQLARAGIPGILPDDWGNLFWHFSKHTETGPVLIVLDEISWMGSKDPNFLGKLKTSWDMYFSKNPELILILCGSISSWIEDNILSSTGFVGRICMDLILEELPLSACNQFWHPREKRISAYEKFKMLSVTGGIPYYLEQVQPQLTAEQNIERLCFKKGGLLVDEFEKIFSDLFASRNEIYKELISLLADGPKDLVAICEKWGKKLGGSYTRYLDHLIKAGFVTRDFTWHLDDGRTGKLSSYRLSDNYLRFYLKYIAPNRSKITRGALTASGVASLASWSSIMGLQFENLVIKNYKALWQVLGIPLEDIVMDGPYFQKATSRQKGCQIDYMIQTRFHTLYLCEIKFSKKLIPATIIDEVKEKVARIKTPRHCSIRPVLIHVNGVEEAVEDAHYFDRVVDFSQLLA